MFLRESGRRQPIAESAPALLKRSSGSFQCGVLLAGGGKLACLGDTKQHIVERFDVAIGRPYLRDRVGRSIGSGKQLRERRLQVAMNGFNVR